MSYLGPGAELVLNKLLKELAEEKISDVISSYEKYTNHYFFEPAIQREVPVTESDVIAALDHLADTGILSGEEFQSRYCVECFGVNVELTAKCPNCGSTKVLFGKIVTHRCGLKDIEAAYGKSGSWVCPQCKEGIYSLHEECNVGGPSYKCKACNVFFEVPRNCYTCSDCGQVYEPGEEPYVRIKKYKPSPILKALRNDIISCHKLFDALCNYLVKNKYVVRRSILYDEDDTSVFWDAIAEKGRSKYGILVLSPSEKLDIITAERIIAKKRTSKLKAAGIITTQLPSNVVQGKLSREKITILNADKYRLPSEIEIKKAASALAPELSS